MSENLLALNLSPLAPDSTVLPGLGSVPTHSNASSGAGSAHIIPIEVGCCGGGVALGDVGCEGSVDYAGFETLQIGVEQEQLVGSKDPTVVLPHLVDDLAPDVVY